MLRASAVIRLHMGHFIAPAHLPFAGAAIVVTAYLVRHPSGPVLLDTGIGVGLPEVETMYKPVRATLDSVLRDAGVSVADVRAIANCHLHFDHSGNNFRFPRVPILTQKVEREAVATPNYTLAGPVEEFDGARFELLEGEAEQEGRGPHGEHDTVRVGSEMHAGDAGGRDRRRVVGERESHDGQTDERKGLGPRRVLHTRHSISGARPRQDPKSSRNGIESFASRSRATCV